MISVITDCSISINSWYYQLFVISIRISSHENISWSNLMTSWFYVKENKIEIVRIRLNWRNVKQHKNFLFLCFWRSMVFWRKNLSHDDDVATRTTRYHFSCYIVCKEISCAWFLNYIRIYKCIIPPLRLQNHALRLILNI